MNGRYPKPWCLPFKWRPDGTGWYTQEMWGPRDGPNAWAGVHTTKYGHSWSVKVIVAGEKYRTSFPHRFQAKAWAEQVMRSLLRDKAGNIEPPIRRHKPMPDYMPPLYRTNQEIAEHEAFLRSLGEKERSEP